MFLKLFLWFTPKRCCSSVIISPNFLNFTLSWINACVPIIKSILLDENDNRIYFKNDSGFEWHKKFDDRGNCIYYKDKKMEEIREYDENNNMIHYKNSNGADTYYDYDSEGRIIKTRKAED